MKQAVQLLTGLLIIDPLLFGASICCRVTDEMNLLIPRADIVIVSLLDSQIQYTVQTGRDGEACQADMAEGLYYVEARREGFLNVRYYPVRVSFPADIRLYFRLPIGDVGEGGIARESVLSGTLMYRGEVMNAVEVCLYPLGSEVATACGVTNDIGQYALTAPPAVYRVTLKRGEQVVHAHTLDLSTPGYYRDRLKFPLDSDLPGLVR